MNATATTQKKQTDLKFPFASVQSEPSRRRILVVEDDIELMTVVDHVVKLIDPKMGRDWVSNVEQAIVLLQEQVRKGNSKPYDLILVDIFLEGEGTGFDLWKLCQEHFPEVPIVVTSAMPMEKFFRAIGSEDISPPFLPKPFKPSECKQLLEGILEYSESKKG